MTRHLACALIIGVSLTSPFASARVSKEDCRDIDLTDRFGPARDQLHTNQCFTSEIADFFGYYDNLTPPKMVSNLDVSFAWLNAKPDGLAANAIKVAPNFTYAKNVGQKIPPAVERIQEDQLQGRTTMQRLETPGIFRQRS